MATRMVWAMPLMNVPPWRCPRCGEAVVYGSRRSLWSLLPGVCRHAIVDWTERIEKRGGSREGLSYIAVGVPVVSVQERGWRSSLRNRLRDELKGRRKHWWGPLTVEAWVDNHRFVMPR